MVAAGYKALKLRVGDSVKNDIARMAAVRKRFGDDMVLLTDANTGYTVEDVRRVMPLWTSWVSLLAGGAVPGARPPLLCDGQGLGRDAAGGRREPLHALRVPPDHRGRQHLDPAARSFQERCITEVQRIAGRRLDVKLPIHPHSSMTGLNHAVSIHFLASIDNGGYFRGRPLGGQQVPRRAGQRALGDRPDGTVRPLDKPGIGVEIDEAS